MRLPADVGRNWPLSQWNETLVSTRTIDFLARELSLTKATARILAVRGFSTPCEAQRFLSPKLEENSVPPELLPGIGASVEVIARHVKAGHQIIVFGDFDADGMTASTILHRTLREIGAQSQIFIPDRIQEGCGVTPNAVERCLRQAPETRLIVTVDCGITHESVCTMLFERGVELVVTDHHEMTIQPTHVAAVVNPCSPGTPEALRSLCGAGVAFKLAQELVRRYLAEENTDRFMRMLIAYAAVGTIGDLVPLVGENRLLASRGLEILNHAPAGELVGIRALRTAIGLKGEIDSGSLAFVLVPRINAAGRMGDPQTAIDLLSAQDMATALPLARRLGEFNTRRREEEITAVREAEKDLQNETGLADRPALVLYNRSWHPGIIGIVASRLAARFHRPTIVFTADESAGCLRGSARCPEIPGLDLVQLLERSRPWLATYGGHRAAAGLTLREAQFEAFRENFSKICAETEHALVMRPESRIEAWIAPEEATEQLQAEVARMGPFGTLNPAPLLAIRALTLLTAPYCFGRASMNWRFQFVESKIPAILFARNYMPFRKGDCIDLVFQFTRDAYGEVHFLVKDMRLRERADVCAKERDRTS